MSLKKQFFSIGLLSLTLLLCGSVSLFAQSNGSIRYLVTDDSGGPLTGANILLYQEGFSDLEDYCVTNFDGFCEFRGLDVNTYRVRISFVGFSTMEENVFVGPNDIVIRQIQMQTQMGELGEVIVEDELGYASGSLGITRIDGEDMSRIPSVSLDGDLMAFIKTVPGVVSIGDQGGDLYIRGGTPVQNVVMVDDLPIIKPFHISNLFSAFPEQVVNNVDVMAGGFDASYMMATSAVIDVNLKNGNFYNYRGSLSSSPYISSVFYEGPIKKGQTSIMLSGRLSTMKEFSGYLGTREQDLEFYDVMARYTVKNPSSTCNFTGIITSDEGKISPVRDGYLSWKNTAFGGRCFGFDDKFIRPVEVSMGVTHFENRELSESTTDNVSRVRQMFMRFDFQDYWFGQKFDYGLNLISQKFTTSVDERFTFEDGFQEIEVLTQVYIKSEVEPTENIRVIPSIGTQANAFFGPTFEPRVRVITKPFGHNDSELSFAAGKYYQSMDGMTDQRDAGSTFTVYRPNAFNGPLFNSIHTIAGWRTKLSPRLTTNLEAYYMRHKDVPVPKWTTIARIDLIPTQANSKSFGINALLEYENQFAYLYMGYSWSKVTYNASSDDLGAWLNQPVFEYSPPHDQTHQLSTIASFKIGSYTASATWELSSGKPYTKIFAYDLTIDPVTQNPTQDPGVLKAIYSRPYNSRLPYYHRLDVSLKRSFRLAEGFFFDAEVGCLNVYDRANVFYVDLNTVERVDQTPILPYAAIKIALR